MKLKDQTQLMPLDDRWNSLARFTYRFRWGIVVICVAVSIGSACGIPKVKTGSNLKNFFPAGHPVLLQTDAMEKTVGPLASVELLLQFGNVDRENDWLRIRALSALASRIKKQTEIKSCLSAATFAPPLGRKRAAGIDRAIENTKLDRLKEEMVTAGLLYIDPETTRQTWRVSCRYGLEDSIEMDRVRRQLRSITEELFIRDGKPILVGEQIDVSTTGEFVLFDLVDREFFGAAAADLYQRVRRHHAGRVDCAAEPAAIIDRPVAKSLSGSRCLGRRWLSKPIAGRRVTDDRQCGVGNRGRRHAALSVVESKATHFSRRRRTGTTSSVDRRADALLRPSDVTNERDSWSEHCAVRFLRISSDGPIRNSVVGDDLRRIDWRFAFSSSTAGLFWGEAN